VIEFVQPFNLNHRAPDRRSLQAKKERRNGEQNAKPQNRTAFTSGCQTAVFPSPKALFSLVNLLQFNLFLEVFYNIKW
jgi:hypothetical protein